MPKVAYNACYGGFSLSREAVLHGREITNDPRWCAPTLKGDDDGGWMLDRDYGYLPDGMPRHDPVLVQVIDEMGKAASGSCADLRLVQIPSGCSYRIVEHDGKERVHISDEWIAPT